MDKEKLQELMRVNQLSLTEEEQEGFLQGYAFRRELEKKMDAVDTAGVEPMVHVVDLVNVLREDVAEKHFDRDRLQEEAPALGKPVLVLRRETERQEAVAAGTVRLAGVVQDDIVTMAERLIRDKAGEALTEYRDERKRLFAFSHSASRTLNKPIRRLEELYIEHGGSLKKLNTQTCP